MTAITEFFSQHGVLWQIVKLALSSVTALVIVRFLLWAERRVARRIGDQRRNINLRYVENIARFVVIFLAVQWVVMGSELTQSFGRTLFQGTAVVAAIAGFAAQPVISDMICGLILSATKPFELGDRIVLEDGSAGIVKDITMRHVVIQDIDTMQIVIPNSKLNGMSITNMTSCEKTRSIHFRFNVAYTTDIDQAMAVIRRAVEESPYSIPGKLAEGGGEYGPVYFIDYAESSLVMATTVYYEPIYAAEVVKSDINVRVKRALDENGIEIPYNYLNVVVNDGK